MAGGTTSDISEMLEGGGRAAAGHGGQCGTGGAAHGSAGHRGAGGQGKQDMAVVWAGMVCVCVKVYKEGGRTQ